MRPSIILLACILLAAIPLSAQPEDTAPECVGPLKTPLPLEASAISTPTAWPNCDSYRSYSGIGRKVDYAAARQCAWRERLAQHAGLEPRYAVASIFGGSAMLTVLYANGDGVKRNISLALRFACEADGAPAEVSGRLNSLWKLESSDHSSTQKFNFCQDITSGFMEGFCAGLSSEIAEQNRKRELSSLIAQWPASHRDAFSRLLDAEKAYAHAHAKGEIDLSGTARAMFQIDAEDSLLDDFQAATASFEQGNLPRATHDQAVAADQQLNTAYRAALANAEAHKSEYGAVQPEGIRGAEHAWLRYRDAFLVFAQLRYPAVAKDAWITLLTKDRISVLDGSFCDMDAVEEPCASPGDTWKPKPLP